MHEVIIAAKVALRLLDYEFLYENKRNFCLKLKTPNKLLHSDYLNVRHDRLVIHALSEYVEILSHMFKYPLEITTNNHYIYTSITYVGSPYNIVRMMVDFDDYLLEANKLVILRELGLDG